MSLTSDFEALEEEVDQKFNLWKEHLSHGEREYLAREIGELGTLCRVHQYLPKARREIIEKKLENACNQCRALFEGVEERVSALSAAAAAEEERIKRVTSPALHRDLPVRTKPLGYKP